MKKQNKQKTIIYINGRFLIRKITGVQRFARETIKELDSLIDQWGDFSFVLVKPSKNCDPSFQLKNIKSVTLNGTGSYVWEQIKLANFVLKHKNSLCLNLCNLCPVLLGKKNIVVIHDIAFASHPEFFKKRVVLAYQLLITTGAKRAKQIFTVSNFSKKEICSNFHLSPAKISVIGSGITLEKQKSAVSEPEKYRKLLHSKFYFCVGSQSPNKNNKYLIECAKHNPDRLFAISGERNRIFKSQELCVPKNVFFLGYLSDEDLGLFYSKCYGFIFPSFYEGFGLPPIEALYYGCRQIIVSDIPVFHETLCGNITYINPHDYSAFPFIKKPQIISEKDANEILSNNTWLKTAKLMLKGLKNEK